MKKIRNILMTTSFLLIIFVIGGFTILKEPDIVSLTENRELAKFEKPTVKKIIGGQFQKNMEDAFADQIIYREKYLNLYSKMNNLLNKTVHVGTSDEMMLVGLGDYGVFKVGVDGEYLVEFPFLKTEYNDQLIQKRINNYNDIQAQNEDLKMYLFKVTNARDTNWFDAANDVECAVPHYKEWLTNGLDSRITYAETSYLDWEDYKKNNYKTDHHWNMYGAYDGYKDLINMLNKDFPEIGTYKEPVNIIEYEVPFYGSLVKKTNFNLDSSIYDVIGDFKYDLPEYEVYLNDKKVDEFGNRIGYEHGDIDQTVGVNHYREAFGKDSAKVVYDFGDNTGVNALFLSDSYSNAIKPVLSSHFDKTTFIDMRYYYGEYGDYFNLKKYIEENDIDLIVYIGGFFTIYMEEAYLVNYY